MQLVSYYSNFQNTCPTIYSVPVSVGLKRWLADVTFFPYQHPWQHSSAQDWGPDYPQGNVSILLFGFF